MTVAEKNEVATTGSATNETVKNNLPKIKPEVSEAAERMRAGMNVDPTTNIIPEQREAINAELERLGYTREGLTKMSTDLHNTKAAYNLASGQTALAHWETQKPEERAPVVAPMSVWEGESTTFTHISCSMERIPGKDGVVPVYGQVNIQNHTNIGRNVGSMSAVRQNLRAAAAASLNPDGKK